MILLLQDSWDEASNEENGRQLEPGQEDGAPNGRCHTSEGIWCTDAKLRP